MARPRGEKDSFFDLLTGLPNRWRFEKRLQQIILRAEVRENGIGLALLDLSGVGLINCTLGHTAGDVVVREAAELVKSHAPPGALVGRLDGDTFGVLMTDLTGDAIETTLLWAENLLRAVHDLKLEFNGKRFGLGGNLGLSFCPQDADNGSDLLRRAYLALQGAKAGNINAVRRFEPDLELAAWMQFQKRFALPSGD